MAAFPVQISSSLDPTVPDPKELREILDTLQIDPNSFLLEVKITQLGFSHDVVNKLRHDTRFLDYTIKSLRKRLEQLKEEHLKITTEGYKDWVEKGIINNDLNFFSMLLISQQPEVIRRLESLWGLPSTGDFNSMVDNYRLKKYTRQCFHYGHSPDFCIKGAAGWGHKKIVEEALEKGATDYDGAMLSASRGGQKEIVQMMLDRGANKYNAAMYWAAEGGQKEIVQMMLGLGADSYNGAMALAAQGGHKDIVQMMLDRGADNYNLAMLFAAGFDHKEIIELIRQYRDRKLS